MDDAAVVAIQIGRPPRSDVVVRTRCHLGLPVVTEVPPILDDGTPFPTSYWLSCPLAVTRISRLEAAGGVKEAADLIATDDSIATQYEEAMVRYRNDRDAMIPIDWVGPKPRGGIAGSQGGVKCLHAQYADTAAGNANPIGEIVAERIEPLSCTVGCVIASDAGPVANADWREPT